MKKLFLFIAAGLFLAGCAQKIDPEALSESQTEAVYETEIETEEETVQEPDRELEFRVENPSWEYYCREEGIEPSSAGLHLQQKKEEPNQITDLERWLEEHSFAMPKLPYSDEAYTYEYLNPNDRTGLLIWERSVPATTWRVDFSEFVMPDEYKPEDQAFIEEEIQYAQIRDGILYTATGHRTYSESAPHTGYVTAMDLETGEVLWKTEPRVSNANNFAIIGDSIVCGYGFTAENDFLYVLDRATGKWYERIPIASAADYILEKDNTLYVRTYHTDYEFEVME